MLGITHVLTVAHYSPPYPYSFSYKCVKIDDADAEDLSSHFDACNQFINEARVRGGVLVHCRHGVSRSATITAAYIWSQAQKTNNVDLANVKSTQDALDFVRSRRSRIGPNEGFKHQLEVWASNQSAKLVAV